MEPKQWIVKYVSPANLEGTLNELFEKGYEIETIHAAANGFWAVIAQLMPLIVAEEQWGTAEEDPRL